MSLCQCYSVFRSTASKTNCISSVNIYRNAAGASDLFIKGKSAIFIIVLMIN